MRLGGGGEGGGELRGEGWGVGGGGLEVGGGRGEGSQVLSCGSRQPSKKFPLPLV